MTLTAQRKKVLKRIQNHKDEGMEVLHFKSQKERLDYLKGGFEEIIPTEVKEEEPKPKKAKKGKKKDGTVQAE